MFVLGRHWHGKNGRIAECLDHSLRMKDSDFLTSATDMSLMAEVMVRSLSNASVDCIRFLFGAELKKMAFDLTKALQELSPEDRSVATRRIELVHAAQRRLGMEPRNDSRLTYNYATGTLDDDEVPSAIASELVVVDNVFKNTNYASIVEEVMREVANHIKYKYKLSWNVAWEMTRFYAPTMLKLYCLRQSGCID